MKKLILTLFLVSSFAISNSVNAQFSVVAGLNLANVYGSDADDSDTKIRPGIRIGAAASTNLTDQIKLTSAAVYSVKGFAFEIETTDNFGNSTGSIDANQSLNYLEIPVDLSFNITDQLALTAGLYTGFLLGQTYTIDGEDFSDMIDEDEISKIDTGLGIGAKIIIESISLNAGYQLGVTSLNADQDLDIKTSNIVIGMSYSF